MESFLVVAHLSSSSALVPVGLGLMRRKNISQDLKGIWWIAVLSCCSDSISLALMSRGVNTWPVNNVYLIAQFILLFVVFNFHKQNAALKMAFWFFLMFAFYNYFILQTPLRFNSFTNYSGGIFMIVVALNFLYCLMREMPVEQIHNLPMLWIAFGVQIYFAGTLFLFLFNNYLMVNHPGTHQASWILHNMLNITKNIFFAIALWKSYRPRTSSL